MLNKDITCKMALLLSLAFCTSGLAELKVDPVRTFTAPDGTKVSGKIDKYSTSSQMVRVRTEAGDVIELPFDKASPENQQIILEWKMDEIVQSSNFVVDYKRIKEDEIEDTKLGTNIESTTEPIYHILTLENKERIAITGLDIRYAIAYERVNSLGKGVTKSSDELGFHGSALPLTDIEAKETKTIKTPTFTLTSFEDRTTSGRDNNREMQEGGGKSTETYEGVVFRFYRNGKLIREEASPTSLAKRDFTIEPNETRKLK